MTDQVLCETKSKRYFKEYLLYRIKEQKANFILSIVLNILTLPLFFAGQISGIENDFSHFYYFGTYFSLFCGILMIVLAAVGSAFSFEFYHKKSLTDTIGSLPLTYKQRFWGDFLAGYVANVAAVIPVGIVTAIVVSLGGKFDFLTEWDFGISTFGFLLCFTFSLIFTLTFIYLFAVLITAACGKIVQSVLFSILGTAAFCGTVAGIAGCFAVGMLGVDVGKYMTEAAGAVPPLGSIIDLIRCVLFFSGGAALEVLGGETPSWEEKFFIAADVPHIIWFVIFGAILILGAYYLGKARKAEKTGGAFVIKRIFYVLCALFCTAAVFIETVTVSANASTASKYLTAIVAGAVMCLVAIVMYLPNKKSIFRCALFGISAVTVSIGIVALIKVTGSFGAAYLPENVKEIEYIRISNAYTIRDKSDMKMFIKYHNDFLRENRDNLAYSEWGEYEVYYETSSGKEVCLEYYSIDDSIEFMGDFEKKLPGYGRYFFEMLNERSPYNNSCHIVETNLTYDITGEDYTLFMETLKREASEKYDPNAEIYARAEFWDHNKRGSFYIGKNMTDTIALLGSLRETAENDPDEVILMIEYNGSESTMTVNVRNKDMDDPLVKELIGLLGEDENYTNGEDWDIAFFVRYYGSVSATSSWGYYVPRDNSDRVFEIMTELAIRG